MVVAQLVAGTGHRDEVGVAEHPVDVAPRQDLGQRVRAGDEEQRRLGHGGVQVRQGVHGVGGADAVDVDAAHREARVRRRGDDRLEVAVFGGADLALDLLPRLTGGHEEHLVEREPVRDLAGRDQVTVVDRVERPAHDADLALHRRSVNGARAQRRGPSSPALTPSASAPSRGRPR